MAELEIRSCADDEFFKAAAEFRIYNKISGNTGKLILEPVNDENNDVKVFLTDKKYSDDGILVNLNRMPITADNPIEIPLDYKEYENSFYLENNMADILTVAGLICYDLSIGTYQATPTEYEVNASYPEMQDPNNQFTDFSEIDTIILTKDELAKIKDYHVIYKITDGSDVDIELIKYQKVMPKAITPELIKGISDENDFENMEFYDSEFTEKGVI